MTKTIEMMPAILGENGSTTEARAKVPPRGGAGGGGVRYVTMRSMTRPEVLVVDMDTPGGDEEAVIVAYPLDEWAEVDAQHLADALNDLHE